jgi:hypothetical protein
VHAQLAQLAHMSAQLTVAKAASEKLASAEGTERVGLLKGGFVKGQWTKEEDELVCKYVELYGTKQWARIALVLPGRKGKQCRERWHNHLNPDISKDAWSNDEDLKLVEAHLVCAPTRILVPHRPRFPSSRALMLALAEMKSWCARRALDVACPSTPLRCALSAGVGALCSPLRRARARPRSKRATDGRKSPRRCRGERITLSKTAGTPP